MTYDVIVIGGGLSGLSAAVELSGAGLRILVLEQNPRCGGRTYSFREERTGDVVDNGQHLLMGCYAETRRYLKAIGSEHLARLQENLRIDFLRPGKGFSSLSCPPLPAPFHILAGLLKFGALQPAHRLKLLRVGMDLQFTSQQKERRLDTMTVDDWLSSLGQTPENKKYLWDIIAIGTLNDDPKTVSALLFFRVLRAAFLGKRENSCLLIPRVGLSELLVDPAVSFIEIKGGEVRTKSRVDSIEWKGDRIESIRVRGKKERAKVYLSAVPYFALTPLTAGSSLKRGAWREHLKEFTSSSIITLHLWFDRPVIERELTALLDSNIQWIFNKTLMFGALRKGNGEYLSLVISGAARYVGWPKQKLIAMARKDLDAVLPSAAKARIVHALVIKEKRATFSPKPGMDRLRPPAKTGVDNFVLAGDWTNTGYPATIEGAVKSGREAAGIILAGMEEE